jgi:hypothetical protein
MGVAASAKTTLLFACFGPIAPQMCPRQPTPQVQIYLTGLIHVLLHTEMRVCLPPAFKPFKCARELMPLVFLPW